MHFCISSTANGPKAVGYSSVCQESNKTAVFTHEKQLTVAVIVSRRRSAAFLTHSVSGAFYAA